VIETVAFTIGILAAFCANDDALSHYRERSRWQTLISVLLAWSMIGVSSTGIVLVLMRSEVLHR